MRFFKKRGSNSSYFSHISKEVKCMPEMIEVGCAWCRWNTVKISKEDTLKLLKNMIVRKEFLVDMYVILAGINMIIITVQNDC